MLRRGTKNGLIGSMPVGGQDTPSSMVGASLLWKNAQKKAKKKQTSEVIKRSIPYRRPFFTGRVWKPWKVASRMTSRHHFMVVRIKRVVPRRSKRLLLVWNQRISPEVIINALTAPVRGHGLWSTKW